MTEPVDAERVGPAQENYLTLTGLVVTFTFWMGAGWLIGGRIGMLVAGALVVLRYAVAIWRAAYTTDQ
jgi:hypothetical protein